MYRTAFRNTRLTLRCGGGRTFCAESAFPPGGPQAPLDHAQVVAKFALLAGPVLGESATRQMPAALAALESVGDLQALLQLLSPARLQRS